MKRNTSFSVTAVFAWGMAMCLLTACASSPREPDRLMAEAEARLDAAEEAEAGREAPTALRSARDHLEGARASIRSGDYELAERQLEKAIVNADYATVKSRSTRMQSAAEEVRRTIETLRIELEAAQAG